METVDDRIKNLFKKINDEKPVQQRLEEIEVKKMLRNKKLGRMR